MTAPAPPVPAKGARKPRPSLPTRELSMAVGSFAVPALVRHVALLPLPERTLALLNGNVEGLSPVDALVVRWAAARTASLAAKLVSGEVRAGVYRQEAAALSGLGPGLTPTGDDLLVGLVAMARRLAAAGRIPARSAAAFAAALAGTEPDTTPAARAMLEKAARGEFPTVLAAVVELLGDPQADAGVLKERAGRLVATGAQSGADLLAGAVALARGLLEWGEAS